MLRKSVIKSVAVKWLAVLVVLTIPIIVFMVRSRPVILSYMRSRAESIMTAAFDEAVKSAINILDYKYSDMAVITRNSDGLVTSVEIDYEKLNLLRAEISTQVYKIMGEKSNNVIKIPIGSLLGNEYTAGYGPSIIFKCSYLQIPLLDFNSKFTAAGINNVFHQININARLSYSVVSHGVDETFTVNLCATAAQTIIIGAVPSNFTNVIETPQSEIADDIFNYSNK